MTEPFVRVQRAFVFGLLLLGGTGPLHAALGTAPRCLPPDAIEVIEAAHRKPPFPNMIETATAATFLPRLSRIPTALDAEQRDYLIRTMVFEATGEPEEGKAAVAHVILNRLRAGRWGDNIKDVVTSPWQFEPWMTRRKEMQNLPTNDPRYQSAARIADAVLIGQIADPTEGATHFLNPVIVRKRRGGSLPAWAEGEGQPIGRHTFYMPDEGPAPVPAGPTLTAVSNPISCSHPFELQVDDSPKRVPNWPAGNLVQLDMG